MYKKRRLASADARAPCEEFPLVGVSRKSVDGVDRAADRNIFAKQLDMFGTIDDLPRNRPGSRESDEDDRRFFAPQITVMQCPFDPYVSRLVGACLGLGCGMAWVQAC